MIGYAEKRFFEWYEDELSVTLRERGGSYGGGSEVLVVLESNQNHATAKDTEVVNALPASMGMGGGYVPMIVEETVGVDLYNQCTTGDVSKTLNAIKSDSDHVPCVIYDARGNGGGKICPTITGDHENRITDYTAVVVSMMRSEDITTPASEKSVRP